MKLHVPKADLNSKRLSEIMLKEASASAEAAKFDLAKDIHRLESKFKFAQDIEEVLKHDLGGPLRGFVGMHIPRDAINRPDLDGRQLCTFWFMDKTSQK